MAYIVRLIIILIAFSFKSAFAGYAQLSPPPTISKFDGFNYGPAANDTLTPSQIVDQIKKSGTYEVGKIQNYYKPAANDTLDVVSKHYKAVASANVGGKSVPVPVAIKYSSKAVPFLLSSLSVNPWLLGAGIVAPFVLDWLNSNETEDIWTIKDGVLNKKYKQGDTICTGPPHNSGCWYPSNPPQLTYESACYLTIRPGGCYWPDQVYFEIGTSVSVASTKYQPVPIEDLGRVKTDFTKLEEVELPKYLPHGLPIENPIINPEPLTAPNPNVSPRPQPLRVPQGDPLPIPNTDPQRWKSPAVDIVPSPTPGDPWRVDVQPKDIITESPDPLPETAPVPSPGDNTQTGQTEVPKEDTPGMCDLYPDILACAKPELDTPEADELKTKEIDIQLNPDGGWSTGSGACPPARQLHVANVQFDIKGVCDGLAMLRPVVLAFAWLLAAVIVVGATKKD